MVNLSGLSPLLSVKDLIVKSKSDLQLSYKVKVGGGEMVHVHLVGLGAVGVCWGLQSALALP